ncbi:MAG: hypothetical protein AABY84_12155 [Candidatus Firestonebacteria bacterium]
MDTKFGYLLSDWDKAKEEMRDVLIEVAKNKGQISYSDLVARVKTISLTPEAYALNAMLEEICREEVEQGRGMLTVVVVHKSVDKDPGKGFFDLAKEFGFYTSKLGCFAEQSNNVYDYWNKFK